MADIGIGFGKFMEGMMGGYQFGRQIKKDKREDAELAEQDALKQKQKDAVQAAKDARAKDIQGKVIPLEKLGGFGYGDQFYSTEEDAVKAAESEAKPFMDYYMKVSAPRIRDTLLESGDVQGAEIWDKWISDKRVQKGVESWSKAVIAAQRNDVDGFAKNLVEAYNNEDYFGDGIRAEGYKVLKKDGKPSGIELTVVDQKGNKTTQTFNNLEEVYQMGMQFMSPENVAQYARDQVTAAQQARAEAAKTQAEYNKEIALEDYRQQGRIQLEDRRSDNNIREQQAQQGTKGSKAVAEADAMAQALRSTGMSEEQVGQLYPQLLGVYRASQSPRDRLQAIYEGLESSRIDPEWQRMSAEQKMQEAKKLMDAQEQILMQNDGSGASTQKQGRKIPMFGPNGQYYVGG